MILPKTVEAFNPGLLDVGCTVYAYNAATDAFDTPLVNALDPTLAVRQRPAKEVRAGSGIYAKGIYIPPGTSGSVLFLWDSGESPPQLAPEEVVLPAASSPVAAGGVISPFPLAAGDDISICELAGVDASDWPLTRLEELPFLPTALSEAKRRVPCEWTTLDALSQQSLRLALLYQAAAQVVPAANPGRTEDFKIGAFALKTDDTGLLADVGELYSYAALYFAEVVLPIGVIPVARPDVFVRPMIRKSKITGSRRIY